MNKFFIIFMTLFISSLQGVFANTTPVQQEQEKVIKEEVMVGFYGRPNTPSLGILGHTNIDKLVEKMKAKQEYYQKELGSDFNVRMAFHIIHSLATKDPGRRNDFLLGLSENSVMRYINRAQIEDFDVIIDLQLGTKTPKEAVAPVLKYLKYPNVHLALDPEFKVPKHRKYAPGKFIGHIFGNDVNEAQESISTYMKENGIEGKRNLIVHMFHERMLRKKEDVKNFDNIQLIYNVDGHGKGGIKVKIYNGLYSEDEAKVAISGFKIFYKTDKKPLMNPKQILGIETTGSRKVQLQPYYINYQ